MKILHIVLKNQYCDGWGYQENLLPEAQAENGNDVYVLASTINSLNECEREHIENEYSVNGVKIIRIAPKCIILHRKFAIYDVESVIERLSPELIFVHDFAFLSLFQISEYKDKHPEVVLFGDTHSDDTNTNLKKSRLQKLLLSKGLWKYINNKVMHSFDLVYYTALQRKDFFRRNVNISEDKMKFLPMGITIKDDTVKHKNEIRRLGRNKLGISDDEIVFITGGRHRKSKHTVEVLNAFSSIESEKVRLVVFGNIDDKDYEKEIMDIINADKRIVYFGWLSQEAIIEEYYVADVALFPGTHSILWQNAAACGLPLVCRYAAGTEELDFGGNCIHIYSDSQYAWKQIISLLIQNKTLIEQMHEVAESYGPEKYNNNIIGERVVSDAKEIIMLNHALNND